MSIEPTRDLAVRPACVPQERPGHDAVWVRAQQRGSEMARHVADQARIVLHGVIARAGAKQRGGEMARHLADQVRIALRGVIDRAGAKRRGAAAPRTMTTMGWLAVIVVCGYAGLAAMLYVTQRSLMYFPDRAHLTPAQAGLPAAAEVTLTTADGEHVLAWHAPPTADKPVVLYFHGNGGAVQYRVERFKKLVADGIGLVALEYRGYGGSSGSPSEAGLIADAQAAYAFAAARYPVPQLVLWGESLGSGIAVALAADKPVGRVILEAPFTSAAAIGAEHYWYMPVRLLMKDQFRSDRRIAKVTAPLLILHGVHDQVVPYAMGERLFELANKPKHIVRFLDGGHEDLDNNGALVAVGRFLAGDLD